MHANQSALSLVEFIKQNRNMMCSATQWLDTNAGVAHLRSNSLLILFMANSLITDVVFDSETLAMLKMLHKFGAPIAKTTHRQQVL